MAGAIQTNVYRALIDVLPRDPRLVGQVATVHGDGTLTVALPGGGSQRIRGSAALNGQVFFKGGVVESAAPDVTWTPITV